MTIPARNLYGKYGDPKKLVEFRLFSFNTCAAGCKNCFYNKTNNNFSQYNQAAELAQELSSNHYSLETCYILPTDVFENDFNYKIFDNSDLQELLKKFNYIGFATTLRNGFDALFIDKILKQFPDIKIEMHVNLMEEKIFDPYYKNQLRQHILDLNLRYPEHLLINLAVNTGSDYTRQEMEQFKLLVEELSHDKILEINFTFLYNSKISHQKKSQLLNASYPLMQYFSAEFSKTESAFNHRTLLRKPSFVFKDESIYLTPILPFDEYVFIDNKNYRLDSPHFDSFLRTYQNIESKNISPWIECDTCEKLEFCHGKSFFSLANELRLGCIKKATI